MRAEAGAGLRPVRARCSFLGSGLQKIGHCSMEEQSLVCGVSSPSRPEPTVEGVSARRASGISMAELTKPVIQDLDQLNSNLRNVVGERHPMLMAAADQIFGAGGKKLRPVIVFLIARATMALGGSRCVSVVFVFVESVV